MAEHAHQIYVEAGSLFIEYRFKKRLPSVTNLAGRLQWIRCYAKYDRFASEAGKIMVIGLLRISFEEKLRC